MKLRNLFAVVFVVVAVVLLAAVASGFQLYGSAVSDQEMESLQASADSTATQLNGLLTERTKQVELLAADPAIELTGDNQREPLQRFIQTTEFQGVSIIDQDGQMVQIESTDLSESDRAALLCEDFSDREYFQYAVSGQPYVSDRVEAETGNRIATISVPLEADGEIQGTVNAALHLDEGTFFESIRPADGTDTALRVTTGEQTLYDVGSWEQDAMIEASASEPKTNWTVTVARPEAAVDDGAQTATLLQMLAVGVVLGTLVGFGLWFYRSNVRQTERVLDGFDRLAAREYGTTIDVGGTDEWTQIGDRFNTVSEELARHERELRQYKEVIERLTDPIMLQNSDGEFQLVNESLATFAGYSQSELRGETEAAFLDDETAQLLAEQRETVMETETAREMEIEPSFGRTEHTATFSVRQYPYLDGDRMAGVITIWRDITGLKEREQELTQYKRAIQEATDLICAIDTDGQYLFANPQYCQYHGVEESEIRDRTITELVPADEREQIQSYIDRTFDGAIVKFQSNRIHPVRGERTLDVRYYPLEEAGTITGLVAVGRDVTEREERAQQLRVVDRVLRHNLRNDLTVIGLQAERIKAGSEGAIRTSAEEILQRSNDLLVTSDKSRNVTEVLSEEPSVRAVEIASLVRDAAATVSESHEMEIRVSAPETVHANTTIYFSRALTELLENAVVHNDSDEPTVDIKLQETAEFVSLRVIDDGPGISRMDVDVLESGRRTEDLYHGSGLGLWMVYWIVTRSGGSVTVQNRTERGTIIEIRLPLAAPS